MITKAQKEQLFTDIMERASKNKDRQAYIHPSAYGYSPTQDGADQCRQYLDAQKEIKCVSVRGKDLLDVVVY